MQRNGVSLGAAKVLPPADPKIVQVSNMIQTNRQARQLLGIAATHIQQAYQVVETIPSNMWYGLLRWMRYFDGTSDLAKQARLLLDRTNAYAQRVYATLPDNDAPVSSIGKKQVNTALAQASSNLQLVSSSANEIHKSLIDDLIDAVNAWIAGNVPSGFPKLPKATGKIIVYVAIGAAGLVGLFVLGKLLHTIALGSAELIEAENAAMAIADAQRRKRSSRSVLSIA